MMGFDVQEITNKLINMQVPDYSAMLNHITPTVEIDKHSTLAYQMQQQVNEIIEKSNQQIKLLTEQNERLESNYTKLEELYNLKNNELQEAKQAEKKAKVYNIVMMVITIISMLVAVAAWLLPNVLGGGA